jgi:hypothetical protein
VNLLYVPVYGDAMASNSLTPHWAQFFRQWAADKRRQVLYK